LTAGTQPRDWPVSETGQARRWAKSSACQDLTLGTEAYCHQFQPNEFMLLKFFQPRTNGRSLQFKREGVSETGISNYKQMGGSYHAVGHAKTHLSEEYT